MTNCGNQTDIPGISMHHFSSAKFYGRSGFGLCEFSGMMSSLCRKKPPLCSAHFDDSCFYMVGSEVSWVSLLVARRSSAMFIEQVRYVLVTQRLVSRVPTQYYLLSSYLFI